MKKNLLVLIHFLIFVSVSSQDVNLEWVKSMGDIGNDSGNSIAVDLDGNIYTTGLFSGTVDFDPGPGVFNLTTTPADRADVFISKSDADGNFVWAKRMGGSADDYAYSIDIDNEGNVYTTGMFYGTADFDPSENFFNLTSAGNADVFVSKLDKNGNFVWAKSFGGSNSDKGFSIAIDNNGNVYTTGHFSETADFNPSAAVFNLTAVNSYDIFVSKLDKNGNFIWAKSMGGTDWDEASSIDVDRQGNVYTTGRFAGVADFDPGESVFNLISRGSPDVFISKLDTNGNFVWAKSLGGTKSDIGKFIHIDSQNNVYTTGIFSGTADFDPGENIFSLTAGGNSDGTFISKLDTNGNFVWAKSFNSTTNTSVESYAMAIDSYDNIYTTGRFSGTVDFDPNNDVFNLTAFFSDVFMVKINSLGSFVWAKSIKGTDSSFGNSIDVDANGNVYTTGSFYSTTDFDPGEDNYNLSPIGGYDIFIHKMSQKFLGTEDINNKNFYVYPNPSKGIFTIQNVTGKTTAYELVDITGKIVNQGELSNEKNNINLTNHAKGVYFLKAGKKTFKLIKQ